MKPLIVSAAIVLSAIVGYWYADMRSEALNAEIDALSARITAVEDSVGRIRPLQASYNALARRVNRINRQAGRVFGTRPVKEER